MSIATQTDDWLQNVAADAMRQGENLRATVRDLTLKALQARELSLTRIEEVVASVTRGINTGSDGAGRGTEKLLAEAFAGMDDALMKAAHASHLAISTLAESGDFEESQLKRALEELERLEDAFLGTVREASAGANERLRAQWGSLLSRAETRGMGFGGEVTAAVEEHARRMREAVRQSRTATLKTAHQMTQSIATLASGVLIGLTEGLSTARGRREAGARDQRGAAASRAPARAKTSQRSGAKARKKSSRASRG